MKMKLTEPSAATAAQSQSRMHRAAMAVADLEHPVVQVLLVRAPGSLPAGGAAHDREQDVDERQQDDRAGDHEGSSVAATGLVLTWDGVTLPVVEIVAAASSRPSSSAPESPMNSRAGW